jgi:diguanylate cyclase (GGDEF)-like protein
LEEIKKVKILSKHRITLPKGFCKVEENQDIVIMDALNKSQSELSKTFSNFPVIIISNNFDLILESQATEFIVPPINQEELEIKLKLVSRKLNSLFSIDPVTNTRSKEYLYQRCNDALSKGLLFSILMLDIDSFKKINDSLGHLEGDRVLQKLSGALKKLIRDSDILARFGGDEFIIMLQNVDASCAKKIAKRIKQGCQEICDISIGVGSSTEVNILEEIIDKADKDLYKAKRS